MQAFAMLGFAPCGDGTMQSGFDKIALYATWAGPTHAARQLPNGLWTSKLGPDADIEHTLEGLNTPMYGAAVGFFSRLTAAS